MDTISELIDKYTGQEDPETKLMHHSCKISGEAKIKLGFLANHLGTKKTSLSGEILEAAINEAFDQVYESFDEYEQQGYAEEMQNYENEMAYRHSRT